MQKKKEKKIRHNNEDLTFLLFLFNLATQVSLITLKTLKNCCTCSCLSFSRFGLASSLRCNLHLQKLVIKTLSNWIEAARAFLRVTPPYMFISLLKITRGGEQLLADFFVYNNYNNYIINNKGDKIKI
jgi:hypothetical protein